MDNNWLKDDFIAQTERDLPNEKSFRSQYMGEWASDYSWPKMRRMYGSRGGGKSEDLRRRKRVQDLLTENRKQLWEARSNSPIVNRAIEVGLSEGLDEAEALLLAVVGLLDENRRLMENAQALIAKSPLPNFIIPADTSE